MSKNAQRLSQVVSTFGPGAMVDLPTRSVVIGGLELWDMRGGSFTTIPEPRLTMRLEQLLKSQNRLSDTKHLSLRTPPVTDGKPGQLPAGIAAPVFPAWFVCEQVDTTTVQASPRADDVWCGGRTSIPAAAGADSSSTMATNRK
jgi:hypothetical protein